MKKILVLTAMVMVACSGKQVDKGTVADVDIRRPQSPGKTAVEEPQNGDVHITPDDDHAQVLPLPLQENDDPDRLYDVAEEMPQFPGGTEALMNYIATHVKYPDVLAETCIQGRVIVTFFVERDGSLSNPVVVKSLDPALDCEAIRVVRSMPKWEPGRMNGKAVRMKYAIPITFRLK